MRETEVIVTLKKQGYFKRIKTNVTVKPYYCRLAESDILKISKDLKDLISQGWKIKSYRPVAFGKKGGATKKPKKSKKGGAKKMLKKGKNKIMPLRFVPTKKNQNENLDAIIKELNRIISGLGSKTKQKKFTDIDAMGLLLSYENGTNPLDYFDKPMIEERKPRILFSPDFSGSCNADAPFFAMLANQLAKNPDIEIYYVENVNSKIEDITPIDCDLVFYIGDDDFFYDEKSSNHILNVFNAQKNVVISNVSCNYIEPKIEKRKKYIYAKGVSYADTSDLLVALKKIK